MGPDETRFAQLEQGLRRLKLRRIREVLDERNQASVARAGGMPRAAPKS